MPIKADDWIESFEIFKKYPDGETSIIGAEHDLVYAGPSPAVVSPEDWARLEKLGWNPSDFDCFQAGV